MAGGSWAHPSTRWSLYLGTGFTCERCARALLPGRRTPKRGASLHHPRPGALVRHAAVLCMQCNAQLGDPDTLLDCDGITSAAANAAPRYIPPWHSMVPRLNRKLMFLGRALARWHRSGMVQPLRRYITTYRLDPAALALSMSLYLRGEIHEPGDTLRAFYGDAVADDLEALENGWAHASELPALWPCLLRTLVRDRRIVTRARCRRAWELLNCEAANHGRQPPRPPAWIAVSPLT